MLQGRMEKLTNGRRSRCASRKTGAVAASGVLFWRFPMSNSKSRADLGLARAREFWMRGSGKPDLRVPFTRAKSRRAHARKSGPIDARSRTYGRASTRVMLVRSLGVLLRAHRVPPACL